MVVHGIEAGRFCQEHRREPGQEYTADPDGKVRLKPGSRVWRHGRGKAAPSLERVLEDGLGHGPGNISQDFGMAHRFLLDKAPVPATDADGNPWAYFIVDPGFHAGNE